MTEKKTKAAMVIKPSLVITMIADDDVPPPPKPEAGRPRDTKIEGYVSSFKAYKAGQSFFVADATIADLQFLRRPFKREGLHFTMRRVQKDEIYHQPGVRVWREKKPEEEL
jgi:hypothetical protein